MPRIQPTVLAVLVLMCIPSSGCTGYPAATATPSPTQILTSRTDAIPEDARKVTPAEDIFPPILHSEAWQPPDLILSQFAAEPTLDPDGNIYFVHHYFRDGSMIEADIYVAYRK